VEGQSVDLHVTSPRTKDEEVSTACNREIRLFVRVVMKVTYRTIEEHIKQLLQEVQTA